MLLALALFFTLMGCREEDLYVQKSDNNQLSTKEDVHKRYTSSYISSRTLQQDLKNFKVKNSVADALSRMPKTGVSKSQFGNAAVYECIYDAVENISTYTLSLVEYSAKNPYFLKHIITVENGVEKSGFIKIIPLTAPVANTEVLDSFSGTVQILDENMKVFSQNMYTSGVSQTAQTGSSSVSSKFDCTNVLYVIVHGCTRGDNHPPGATCDNGEVSDGYYELTTQLVCGNWGPEDNTIAPSEGTIGGGGGGGATLAHELLNHSLFQHTGLLLDPNKRDLLNLAMAYIQPIGMLTGFTLSDSQVIAINQKLDVFMNNPQLFDNFDLLQAAWSTSNYYFPGTANYYDQRIVKLMQNLFDNPTQQNADFTSWATQFYMQNPSSITNHFSQHPEDLEKILFKGLNYNKISDVAFANKFALAFTEILIAEKNNTVNQVNVQDPTWSLAKEYMIYLIKQNAASAVKYGRVIYEHASQYFSQHPNSLQKVNSFLEYLKVGVELEIPIEKNHQYMKWTDVLLCWLFELGDFPVNDSAGYGNLPTIGFSGLDYTISGPPSPNIIPMRHLSAHKMKNGIPDVNSVLDVKKIAIERIKLGNYTPFNREWVFGSDATVDTITKLDGMQFCLGSYRTDVYITVLGNNQYKLTYIIKNKTGWQSGTRGLNDYNGNPTDDSIIPDKPRGTGVHLGGTIGETFGWYEIITVP